MLWNKRVVRQIRNEDTTSTDRLGEEFLARKLEKGKIRGLKNMI